MPALNIFIDGTWLLNQCSAGGSLANSTDQPNSRFPLDFAKLNNELVNHARQHDGKCESVGDAFIATSIFKLPPQFEDWPNQYDDVTPDQVEKTKRAVAARELFVRAAANAGYSMAAVFRPAIRDYIIRKLAEQRYQEKQVDTAVVALLVKSAITKPNDYHAIITGDSDILPAVHVAYPEFTKNVFVATTHPDELNPKHRQTAFSLVDFDFSIAPYYMQNKGNAEKLIAGAYAYRCEECGRVFTMAKPVPKAQRPRCLQHRAAKPA